MTDKPQTVQLTPCSKVGVGPLWPPDTSEHGAPTMTALELTSLDGSATMTVPLEPDQARALAGMLMHAWCQTQPGDRQARKLLKLWATTVGH